jgi:uncharacterized protein (TIGR03083 family)
MKIHEHIEALRREGGLLAVAAERSGTDAPVPTCPEWRVRDLVHHTGGVHRWATAHIVGKRTEPLGKAETQEVFGAMPEDPALIPWFRAGHAALVAGLEDAEPDLECWHFLKAPSPLAFWARRQAHETTIHRVDAELAAGDGLTPVDPAFAADGIDELLAGFHTRSVSRVRTDEPCLVRVHATDTGDEWFVHLSAEPARVTRSTAAEPDCTIGAPAEALYLALWNRALADVLDVDGDASLLELWQDRSAVKWR